MPNALVFNSPDEAAAFWDARLRASSCAVQDRADFAAWHDADPAHAAAYQQLQDDITSLRAAYPRHPELRALRDEAVRHRNRSTPLLAAGLAAAAVVGGVLAAGTVWYSTNRSTEHSAPPPSATYQTARGERRAITLSDGSVITLDTQSRIAVSFSPGRRGIDLMAGQALFEVAKNPARPFVVTAGSRTVTAVGTAFDVRIDPATLTVTMVEGRVRVASASKSAAESDGQSLVAGQRLTASGAGPASVTTVDPREATGWSQGRVVFVDRPLSEALAEINRYSTVRFSLADPSLEAIRINGLFRTEQPLSFVQALAAYLPIELHTTADGVILAARPGAAS